jgi:hypothetical protein
MRIAFVGSRKYPHPDLVRKVVRDMRSDRGDFVAVSGGANGVDKIAIEEAEKLGCKTMIFVAEWDKHGKSAGPLRNGKIVEAADRVVAFWDGESRGTKDTIDKAIKAKKPLMVYDARKGCKIYRNDGSGTSVYLAGIIDVSDLRGLPKLEGPSITEILEANSMKVKP